MILFPHYIADPPVQEIIKREKKIINIETLISSQVPRGIYGTSFEEIVPKTSQRIIDFWNQNLNGKAILILDGLSLREMPSLSLRKEKNEVLQYNNLNTTSFRSSGSDNSSLQKA